MPLNFEETTDQQDTSEVLSDKARDILKALRRFRASHAPDPVFHSVRSRPIETEAVLDWNRS